MSDRLDAMQAFIAVCDAQGFAAAARKLELSPSVVTRLIAALEKRLGVRLLQRTTRTVRLTDAGERFLDRARRVLADLEEAELSAQEERSAPTGRLVVAAAPLLSRDYLVPLLSRYLSLYPTVQVDLQLASPFASLVEEGIDVAIRIGDLPDSGLISRLLGHTRRVLVASPDYLAAEGTPTKPADLLQHRLIAFAGVTPRREWPFRVDGNETVLRVEPHFFSNSGEAAIDYAIRGGGIVSALSYQTDKACQAGQLVEVLPEFASSPVSVHVLFPSARLLSRKVRAFLDLLDETLPDWRLSDERRRAAQAA